MNVPALDNSKDQTTLDELIPSEIISIFQIPINLTDGAINYNLFPPETLYYDYLQTINTFLPVNWSQSIPTSVLSPKEGGRFVLAKDAFPFVGIDFHKLKHILLEYDDPILHIGFITNLLSILTKDSDSIEQKRYYAMLAFYIFCPIAEFYGETDLLIQLQDAAFAILAPKEYEQAKLAWEKQYVKRLEMQEVKNLGEEIKDKITLIAGNRIPNFKPENIKIKIRQKSLYSYFQKEVAIQDRIAVTVSIDGLSDATLAKELKKIFIAFLKQENYTMIDSQNNVLEDKDNIYYQNIKDSITDITVYKDKMFRVVKGAYLLNGNPISLTLTSPKYARLAWIRHPWYKRFTRVIGSAAAIHVSPPSPGEIDALADYSQTNLERKKTGDYELKYALKSTKQIVDNINNAHKNRKGALLYTAKGRNMVPVKEGTLFEQLRSFSNNVRKDTNASRFRVFRKTPTGSDVFIVDLNSADKSAKVYSVDNPVYEIQNFKLQDFDYVFTEIVNNEVKENIESADLIKCIENNCKLDGNRIVSIEFHKGTEVVPINLLMWIERIIEFKQKKGDDFTLSVNEILRKLMDYYINRGFQPKVQVETRGTMITTNEILNSLSNNLSNYLEFVTIAVQLQRQLAHLKEAIKSFLKIFGKKSTINYLGWLVDMPNIEPTEIVKHLLNVWSQELFSINQDYINGKKTEAKENYLLLKQEINKFMDLARGIEG